LNDESSDSRTRSEVIVVDKDGTFLLSTNPAKARKLLKSKAAVLIQKHPPAIKLKRKVDSPDVRRRNKMQIPSFTKFFSKEKDIYIQNVSGGVVSMVFGTGEHQEPYTLQNSRDPVILTNFIPFAKIKESTDFRKMATNVPPRIAVLTEKEYEAYYARKQNITGKSDEELKREAEQARITFQNRQNKVDEAPPAPIHKVVEDGKYQGEKKRVEPLEIILEGETINPRLLGVCQKVSREIPQDKWPPAIQVLEELQTIADTVALSSEDLDYIRANVPFKTVRKWAQNFQNALAAAEEIDDGLDEVLEEASQESVVT